MMSCMALGEENFELEQILCFLEAQTFFVFQSCILLSWFVGPLSADQLD